jgi:signal transduction histidine kinase
MVHRGAGALPGDVPLDQPAGPLTDRHTNEWAVQFPRWEILFAAGWVIGLTLTWLNHSGTDTPGRILVTGLIVAMAGWWTLFGRRLAIAGADDDWRGLVYVMGLVALFTPVAALIPVTSWMLFGLSPQPFMVRSHRWALLWVSLLNAAPPVAVLVRFGFGVSFGVQVIAAVAIVVFSHLVGTTVDRVVRESHERGELIAQLEASRAEVAALSREAGVTGERERLAGEIHDTLAQGFTSILTLVHAAGAVLRDDPDRAAEHLRLAAETARENLGEARALVGALAPAALGTGTLVDALRRQVARVRDECPIEVELVTSGDVGTLPMPAEVVLLRAAQEALTNVRKHSGATTAVVNLAVTGGSATLAVVDDGVGFDADKPTAGFGLAAMRSRAAQVGGSVSVTSGSTGTVLRVEVPR